MLKYAESGDTLYTLFISAANRHDSKETERILTEPPKEAHGVVYNMCRLVQIKKYQPNLIAIQ